MNLILRLLEKEPDRRYQSASGLAHDLGRMRDELARGELTGFPLGERDFPLRLAAPSRLVGRDVEIATLREAFEDAMTGHEIKVDAARHTGRQDPPGDRFRHRPAHGLQVPTMVDRDMSHRTPPIDREDVGRWEGLTFTRVT